MAGRSSTVIKALRAVFGEQSGITGRETGKGGGGALALRRSQSVSPTDTEITIQMDT